MNLKSILLVVVFAVVAMSCQQNTKKEKTTTEPMEQKMEQPTQKDVSDADLETFLNIDRQIQVVNQGAQQKFMGIIEKTDMSIDRFNEIQQAQQNPQESPDFSEEELETFRSIMQKVSQEQAKLQQKAQEIIKKEGLSLERYQQIRNELSNNPEMQKKLMEMQK
jgi:phenylalanine-4-hydroxylase